MTTGPDPVATAARASCGRLVAFLAARWGDLAAAEDAVGDALLAALERWPEDGVPDRPEAWLMRVAKRRLLDDARRARVRTTAAPLVARLAALRADAPEFHPFPDKRLALLFMCAHPAIDPSLHAPLMLQSILRIDAERIASAFLISPAAMRQRLVRTKRKIRDARLSFELPAEDECGPRVDSVLRAIYATYGAGWDDPHDTRGEGLASEAESLARMVVELRPDEPEALGLLALILFCEGRTRARRSADGTFVPLLEQNPADWDRARIGEAETVLRRAASRRRPCRFQLEAAIQSGHCMRVDGHDTPWGSIDAMYRQLVALAPTLGNLCAAAVARSHASGVAEGWRLLESVDPDTARSYQPYWAARAHLLERMGRTQDAGDAYRKAAALTVDQAVQSYLRSRAGSCSR